jgi:hypothetical protein
MASISVSFPDTETNEARRMALGLREHLLNESVVENAEIIKADDDTADLGAVLQIVMAAPMLVAAATEIAKGIADWIRGQVDRDRITIELERPGDTLRASGSADEVQHVVEQWLRQ